MKKKLVSFMALAAASALALTACGSGDAGSEASGSPGGDKKELTIGVFAGWDEGIAVSNLWKSILDKEGYDVTLTTADAAPVFTGITTGDFDMTMDVWLPDTHKTYLEKYGDKMQELGTWNENAKLTVAVNKDADITSLDELASKADMFDNRIVGIDPGAGLTAAMKDRVIPEYGLDKMEFVTSSTTAMLTQLKKATTDGDNIAVTLWRPHWAYDAFPIKDLEDPKGALGAAEHISTYGSLTFKDDFPTVAGWMKDFKMDDEKLFSLENAMFNQDETQDYGPIVEKWIGENQEWVDSLTAKK
ncbi:glycine/betaine ABC transporter substrate-binding protein [Arthrobacter sp. UCD-GKA]|jgi:glycine betaine/proline transport system substrate-binding protein|uniref:glycine betaine ABC transporter substrate-binding protein n=1 Tax=Arthrobacter sp. UCD-GKA TaxID=1913576 RepID=UPI0008DDE5EE|nr:glycine betaine ABC transporter substrate-binding protein [Arthrobacter sp. UCD-GKA]OIH84987.1 glycine/betaine ABC transporter substrate-binding protein [Arthrobacter sp. UCD-GKA]